VNITIGQNDWSKTLAYMILYSPHWAVNITFSNLITKLATLQSQEIHMVISVSKHEQNFNFHCIQETSLQVQDI